MLHYLDHAAGTPVRDCAVEAMLRMVTTEFGNPSGAHRLARNANRALDDAREAMADAIGVDPGEVVFTSGGTEADNLAINGVIGARGGVNVYVSDIENLVPPNNTVRSMRIWLLMRADRQEFDYLDDKEYQLGDKIIPAADDNYRRLVVSKTIFFRNLH